MSLFYAKRYDKNGNLLVTSYTNLAGAKKFGGDGSQIDETVYSLLDNNIKADRAEGKLVRSVMMNKGDIKPATTFEYSIYAKIDDIWSPVGMTFPTYGDANSYMKNNISCYVGLAVVKESADSKIADRPASDDEIVIDF